MRSKEVILIKKLNSLLSSYQVVNAKARSFRWIIKGDNVFELMNFVEAMYNDASIKIEEIANRILHIGGKPLLSLSDMVKHSEIKEGNVSSDMQECIDEVLQDLHRLRDCEIEIKELAEQTDDPVTADLMSFYITQQLKSTWLLNQFLNPA